MIRCMVIKLEVVFEDHGEVEEVLSKRKLPKDAYRYIGNALVDSCDNNAGTVLGS